MKILFAGNIANNGYMAARLCRQHNLDSYLLMEKDPPQAYDPFRFDPNLKNSFPNWILFYDKTKPSWKIDILKKMRKFDIVQGHYDFAIFGYFSRRPLVAQIVGSDLNELAVSNSVRGRLLRKAYRNAKVVLFDGPTQKPLLSKLKVKNAIFFPMLFDTDFFCPKKVPKGKFEEKFTIFHPSYLDWPIKGNDILIRGFSDFVKKNKNSILIIVARGPDSQKTHELVNSLKINNNVEFVKGPLNSTNLREFYNLADVVADQFTIGNLGAISRETLSSGKPLLTYYLKDLYEELYGEAQPAVYAKTVSDVATGLQNLLDNKLREKLGKQAISWVQKYHSKDLIFAKMKKMYEMILDNKKIEEIKMELLSIDRNYN